MWFCIIAIDYVCCSTWALKRSHFRFYINSCTHNTDTKSHMFTQTHSRTDQLVATVFTAKTRGVLPPSELCSMCTHTQSKKLPSINHENYVINRIRSGERLFTNITHVNQVASVLYECECYVVCCIQTDITYLWSTVQTEIISDTKTCQN